MTHQSGCRNHIVVDGDGASPDGSVIDLTPTGTQRVPGCDEEEYGMGDGGALSHVSRLVSHALLYFAGDRTSILGSAASRRTWPR